MPPVSRSVAPALDLSAANLAPPPREFDFSDADFRSLAQIARERTGIALADTKRDLVYGRLSRRLRMLGMSSFRQYRDYLEGADGEREIEKFINSISRNHTISSISVRTWPAPSFARRAAPADGCESGPPAARPARNPIRSHWC